RSHRPRRNCRGGRSEEACVRSDRFPSSYPTRLLGKRVFLLHGNAAMILAHHLVADTGHLVEIVCVLERSMRCAPRDDLLGCARVHALELHELGLARLVDVDLRLGGRRDPAPPPCLLCVRTARTPRPRSPPPPPPVPTPPRPAPCPPP